MVTTRAQTQSHQLPDDGFHPTEQQGLSSIFNFHDDLFVPSRPSRSFRKPKPDLLEFPPNVASGCPLTSQGFAMEQQQDASLAKYWSLVGQEEEGASDKVRFRISHGFLYRDYDPDPPAPEADRHDTLYRRSQLVLPKSRRNAVLQLAHAVPMAGHMGQLKTTQRILRHFWWPGVTNLSEVCPQ